MARSPWRSYGVAFLLTGLIGALAAWLEMRLPPHEFAPGGRDLLYAIDLHLVAAAVVCLAARLVAYRASQGVFLALALGGMLAVELGLVAAFWISTTPWIPPFSTSRGKLATAGLAAAGGLVGLLGAWALARSGLSARLAGLSRGALAPVGLGLAGLVLVANLALLWSARPPREVRPRVEDDVVARERSDVLLILVDTLRRDHLGFFGYDRPTSPNMDRLFSESWVWTEAATPSTWTIPSIASLFTGLYPVAHKVNTAVHALPEEAPTLAEHFRALGYRTAAFVGNQIITNGNGFAQGFETFYPPEPPFWSYRQRTAFEQVVVRIQRPGYEGHHLNRELLAWFADTTGPRFAYIHYMEPHSPYAPPLRHRQAVAPDAPDGPRMPPRFADYKEQLQGRDCHDWSCLDDPPRLDPGPLAGMVANYDGEIHYVDALIGTVLSDFEEQGLLDGMHVVFCSDHGEEFCDHGGWFHGNSIYEEISGCPMAYRPPGGLAEPRVLDRPVGQLDIAYTLCAVLEIPPPPMHQGREIPELLGQAPPRREEPVICELPPYLASLRLRQWKLLRRGPADAGRWELFDMASDPTEQRDLADVYPDTLAYLRGHLEGLQAARARGGLAEIRSAADPQMLQRLKDLGYIR